MKRRIKLSLNTEHAPECRCELCRQREGGKALIELPSVELDLRFNLQLNVDTILPPILPSLLMELELEGDTLDKPTREFKI